jgi:NTE family protein
MQTRPDVLVLGSGGVLGEAWMTGVLAGIEDSSGFELQDCEHFLGTSAGAVVAARLAAARPLRRPPAARDRSDRHEDRKSGTTGATAALLEATRLARAWVAAAGTVFASPALELVAPAGSLARAAALQAVPRPHQTLWRVRDEIDKLALGFDGRLRVVAVQRRTGRRVVFGRPGSPPAAVADAVAASCAVPWLFAPVRIGDREYVDGGVWSATNLDAAPAGQGTHLLCLNPTAGLTGAHSLVGLARSFARSAVSIEALALRRRGAVVRTVQPSREVAAAMGADFMNHEPGEQVLAAGYEQGLGVGATGRW